MKHTDEQLVKHFLEGDEQALEALVEKYLKPLFGFIYQLTQDKTAAEDITQEVFVKMWQKISSFDSQKKFSTWLYAIAKNTAVDWLRKKKTIPFAAFENADGVNMLEFIEDQKALHSEEMLKAISDKKNVANILNSMSPIMQTIFLLHNVQGFSLAEIAEILGRHSNTIKSKYRRAIMSLRQQFSSKNTLDKAKLGN